MTPFRPKGLINPSLNTRFLGGSKGVDGLPSGHPNLNGSHSGLLKDFFRGILIIDMLLASLRSKEVEDEAMKDVKWSESRDIEMYTELGPRLLVSQNSSAMLSPLKKHFQHNRRIHLGFTMLTTLCFQFSMFNVYHPYECHLKDRTIMHEPLVSLMSGFLDPSNCIFFLVWAGLNALLPESISYVLLQ